MNPSRGLLPVLALCLGATTALRAASDDFQAPDSLVLKNGKTVYGLIIKNTREAVLLQQKEGETSYPKRDIVRIRDEENNDSIFTGVSKRGDLPSWRVIANDLRSHDEIKSLVEIPPTFIDSGVFKNVPYMSFRANRDIELDIYGDPEDPAGFEMGIFGPRANNPELQKTIRAFIAGFLATRKEINTLYDLSLKGGVKSTEHITIEITPRTAKDAQGAWWISLYNPAALDRARISDAEYAKATKPVDQVIDKQGRVLANVLLSKNMTLTEKVQFVSDSARALLRGFYRDKNGDLRLLQQPDSEAIKRAN